jgi:hypothetical protein
VKYAVVILTLTLEGQHMATAKSLPDLPDIPDEDEVLNALPSW